MQKMVKLQDYENHVFNLIEFAIRMAYFPMLIVEFFDEVFQMANFQELCESNGYIVRTCKLNTYNLSTCKELEKKLASIYKLSIQI